MSNVFCSRKISIFVSFYSWTNTRHCENIKSKYVSLKYQVYIILSNRDIWWANEAKILNLFSKIEYKMKIHNH